MDRVEYLQKHAFLISDASLFPFIVAHLEKAGMGISNNMVHKKEA
jgi:hypothetical protein